MTEPLTNVALVKHAKKMGIVRFRGVYSKDSLPAVRRPEECGIVNLQDSKGPGTHWVAYYARESCTLYFDSFGLPPPKEVKAYLGGQRIIVNQRRIQKSEEVVCGQYCLFVLYHLSKGANFFDIVNKLHEGQ